MKKVPHASLQHKYHLVKQVLIIRKILQQNNNRREEFVGKMQKENLTLKKLMLKSYFHISLEKVQSKSTETIYKTFCTYLSINYIPSSDFQKQKNDASAD